LHLALPPWRQKLELVKYKKTQPDEFPWNKYVPDEAITKRTAHVRETGSSHGIASDLAVGAFIKHAYQRQDVEVDFIHRDEISVARLKSNDLNFVLIYDLLECFHMDPTKSKKYYKEMKDALTKAKNIYPPLDYQKFLGSKMAYYQYFKDHGVPIVPTVTMTTAQYKKLGHAKAVQHILEQVRQGDWGKFCAKPEYGQDGRDFKSFVGPQQSKALDSHIRFCMKKYPGIVFQKMIQGFGCNLDNAEMRMYYYGSNSSNKYNHSIIACAGNGRKTRVFCPEKVRDQEKLKKVPVSLLKRASRRVVKTLPTPVMPDGIRLPRLVTRVDMGFNMDGTIKPFVNEVEFCPSYYVEDAPMDRTVNWIQSVGRQVVRIARLYAKRRVSLRKPMPSHHLKRQRRQR
jgi:hypothetical protein